MSIKPSFLLKALLFTSFCLLPNFAHAIGAAGDTPWPKDAKLEIQLKLTATLDAEKQPKIAGDLIVINPGDATLTIQEPTNRLVLAFLVLDDQGNPVAPHGWAKVDNVPFTRSLAAHATYTLHFERLDFLTGSILQSYTLTSGKSYRVIAVYRPAGPNGPGFTSRETELKIP